MDNPMFGASVGTHRATVQPLLERLLERLLGR